MSISAWAVAKELLSFWPKSQAETLATRLLIKKTCKEKVTVKKLGNTNKNYFNLEQRNEKKNLFC